MLKHVENIRMHEANCVYILSQTLLKDMIKPAALPNIYTHTHTLFLLLNEPMKTHSKMSETISRELFKRFKHYSSSRNMQNEFCTLSVCVHVCLNWLVL